MRCARRERCRLAPLLVALLAGCGASASPHVEPDRQRIRATITLRSAPAKGAIAAIISGDGSIALDARANADGIIEVDAPPGIYRVWIAHPDGFWEGEAKLDVTPVQLELNPECGRVSVEIAGDAPPGTILWLQGLKQDQGFYGAIVTQQKHLQVCLPAERYAVFPPDGFEIKRTFVDVPSIGLTTLDVYSIAKVEEPPPPFEGWGTPRRGLLDVSSQIPSETSVVAIGEADHGTSEFFQHRTDITLDLATRHGAVVLALEAGAAETIALDRYVNGHDVAIAEAVAGLGYWTWDTFDFLEALARIREYNERVEVSRRIRIRGIDVQKVSLAVDMLLAKSQQFGWSEEERVLIDSLKAGAGENGGLDRIDKILAKAVAASQKVNDRETAFLVENLRSSAKLAGMAQELDKLRYRDQGMATMVERIVAERPTSLVVVWAHNLHVASDDAGGVVMMGVYLRKTFGDRYWALGQFAYEGVARAWDAAGKIGVVENLLGPARSHSLEAAVIGDAQVAFVDLREVSGEGRRWLESARKVREFGSWFPGDAGAWALRYVLRAYDGALVVRRTHPSRPTPTGVRVAEP